MRVVYLIQRKPVSPTVEVGASPLALAVSDWDGVHRGHVALARRAAKMAATMDGRAVALLPWPSPEGGDNTPGVRLTTLEERIARLDALNCFETLLIAPAPTESRGVGDELGWLRDLGDVRALLGEPHAIGAVTWLWPDELANAAREAGITVERGPWLSGEDDPGDPRDPGQAIRALVRAGRVREATAALGYTYTVTGEVVGGDRRGRLLGFPTANLRLEPSKLAPGNGIYAGWARLPGNSARWPAAISIGVRPTFGQGLHQQIEAHLLDATMDLYGLQLRIEFVEYLREELRFDSFEALIEQMGRDREQARAVLAAEAPTR